MSGEDLCHGRKAQACCTCGLEFYRFKKCFKENVQKLGERLQQLFFKNLDWFEKGSCALRTKLCILISPQIRKGWRVKGQESYLRKEWTQK